MNDTDLRSRVIRLAAEKPELRSALLPLLKAAAPPPGSPIEPGP